MANELIWTVKHRLIYLVNHCLPHSSNGYAVRTHMIAKGLAENGCDVIVVSRPGYPYDINADNIEFDSIQNIQDGIRYIHLPEPRKDSCNHDEWLNRSVSTYKKLFKVFKPTAVVAASNWELAMPACKAARAFELPFIYEVRGFWEISRASVSPEFRETKEYSYLVDMESQAARSADKVFTLNIFMKEELIKRGVIPENILIMPNGFEEQFPPSAGSKSDEKVFTIGYIGSFTKYEGLELLIHTIAVLKSRHINIELVLVGSSNSVGLNNDKCELTDSFENLASKLNVTNNVKIINRMSSKNVGKYYDLIDLIIIPRKKLEVSDLVSPIKPLEAVARCKAMILSDLRPFAEFFDAAVAEKLNGWNAETLATQIMKYFYNPELLSILGNKGLAWHYANRRPRHVTYTLANYIKALPSGIHFSVKNRIRSETGKDKIENAQFNNSKSQHTSYQSKFLKTSKPDQRLLLSTITNPMTKKLRDDSEHFAIQSKYDNDKFVATCRDDIFGGDPQYKQKSISDIEKYIIQRFSSKAKQAVELTKLAKLALGKCNEIAVYFASAAFERDPKCYRKKWLGFFLFNSGNISKSIQILDNLSSDINLIDNEKNKLNYISGCAKLFTSPPKIKGAAKFPCYKPTPKKVMYVASSSRPHHYNGYTSRTHGIIKGIIKHGWEVLCVTRPGYPADRDDRVESENITYELIKYDGVSYQALAGLHRRNDPLDQYLYNSVEVLVEKARECRAAVIHAASNYEAALPALLAAKRLGIQFVYEVRGLWEFTAASRTPCWENTERFKLDAMLEAFVVKNSDGVATLTSALSDELVKRGADREKIVIVPNAVDPEEFKPRNRNHGLANIHGLDVENFVFGYAGSIVSYEGLDDLVAAFSILHKSYPCARLLIVGDGKVLPELKKQSCDLSIDNNIIFTGRVSSEKVPEYLSLVDVMVLPRKPYKVCHLVSPLKPFEAMSMEVPLVVSDVAALNEIACDGKFALVHKSGDIDDLALCLKKCIDEKLILNEISKSAKIHVDLNYSWEHVTKAIVRVYEKLTHDEQRIKI